MHYTTQSFPYISIFFRFVPGRLRPGSSCLFNPHFPVHQCGAVLRLVSPASISSASERMEDRRCASGHMAPGFASVHPLLLHRTVHDCPHSRNQQHKGLLLLRVRTELDETVRDSPHQLDVPSPSTFTLLPLRQNGSLIANTTAERTSRCRRSILEKIEIPSYPNAYSRSCHIYYLQYSFPDLHIHLPPRGQYIVRGHAEEEPYCP